MDSRLRGNDGESATSPVIHLRYSVVAPLYERRYFRGESVG
jgi:hypothetical protein